MKLVGKLTRVEKLAGKGSCPDCRLSVRRRWPDPSKPNPGPQGHAPILTAACKLCGRKITVDLSGHPSDLLPMLRLFYRSTLEEEFTDARAWAAGRWAKNYFAAQPSRGHGARRNKPPGQIPCEQQQEAGNERRASPDTKLLGELRAEREASRARARRRLAAKYGDNPFPDLASQMDGAMSEGFAHRYNGEWFYRNISLPELARIDSEATPLLECAEAEKIVLGHAAPSTAAALADCEQQALTAVEAAKRVTEEYAQITESLRAEAERRRPLLEARERGPAPAAAPAGAEEAEPAAGRRPSFELLIDRGTLAASRRRSEEAAAALPPALRPKSYPPLDPGAPPARQSSPHNKRTPGCTNLAEGFSRSGK